MNNGLSSRPHLSVAAGEAGESAAGQVIKPHVPVVVWDGNHVGGGHGQSVDGGVQADGGEWRPHVLHIPNLAKTNPPFLIFVLWGVFTSPLIVSYHSNQYSYQ